MSRLQTPLWISILELPATEPGTIASLSDRADSLRNEVDIEACAPFKACDFGELGIDLDAPPVSVSVIGEGVNDEIGGGDPEPGQSSEAQTSRRAKDFDAPASPHPQNRNRGSLSP